jgi:sugar-specific transcriptional regulator TrmB
VNDRLRYVAVEEISELPEVPRTRVSDAIGVPEAGRLVETQHSTPKRFRAVPDDAAVETLRSAYEDRNRRAPANVGRDRRRRGES